jgi:hypothetical protein
VKSRIGQQLHKVNSEICHKRDHKDTVTLSKEMKVVMISSQPGCRNSGKNRGKILIGTITSSMAGREKMSGKFEPHEQ